MQTLYAALMKQAVGDAKLSRLNAITRGDTHHLGGLLRSRIVTREWNAFRTGDLIGGEHIPRLTEMIRMQQMRGACGRFQIVVRSTVVDVPSHFPAP